MILAVFDIDGTLLDTSKVDGDCFVRALELEFDISQPDQKWEEFNNATDSGIIYELFQRTFSRPPGPEEVRAFVDRFVSLLKEAHARAPRLFREIEGAGRLLRYIIRTDDCRAALATGGWRASASFKLECAGISPAVLPFATAEDGLSREQIIRSCIKKAEDFYDGAFSKVVSIGDGLWDIKAARRLGLTFIGIGDEARLSELGANYTVRDFRNIPGFIEMLKTARGRPDGSLQPP